MDLSAAERLTSGSDPQAIRALQQNSSDPAVGKAVAEQFGTLLMQRLMQNGDGEAIGMADGVGGNIVNGMFASTMSQAAMSGDRLGLADLLFKSMQTKQNPAAAATGTPAATTPQGVSAASGATPTAPAATAGNAAPQANSAAAAPPRGFTLSPYWQANGGRPLGNPVLRTTAAPPGAPRLGFTLPTRNAALTAPAAKTPAVATPAAPAQTDGTAAAKDAVSPDATSFAKQLVPLLQNAAQRLGVSPKVLLAHAALETGWGRSVVGNNIFGVKAGGSWGGDKVVAATHEIENGQSVPQMAAFRAYPNLAAAVQDYVSLISGSQRYQDALGKGEDAHAYAAALISGGYATDGNYPAKLQTVAASATMAAAFGGAPTVLPPINLLARQ